MNTRLLFSAFAVTLAVFGASSQAVEPSWLFTVPKAESLKEGHYSVGFVYFDLGITDNLEVGIHGLKYSLSGSMKFAFGLSPFLPFSPYAVLSPDIGPGELHLGAKLTPYIVFAGFGIPLSDRVKFVAELNNGLNAGVRVCPAQNWTLDIFATFTSREVYKEAYRYRNHWVEIEHYRPNIVVPMIFFAYSGRL